MHDVLGLKRTLLAFDDQRAVAGKNQEGLLPGLVVVERRGLSRAQSNLHQRLVAGAKRLLLAWFSAGDDVDRLGAERGVDGGRASICADEGVAVMACSRGDQRVVQCAAADAVLDRGAQGPPRRRSR